MQANTICVLVTVLVCVMVYPVSSATVEQAENASVSGENKNNDSVSDTKTEEQISNSTTDDTTIIEKGATKEMQETKVKTTVVETKKVEIRKMPSDTKSEPKTKTVLNSVGKISDTKQTTTTKEIIKSKTRENPTEKTQKQTSKVDIKSTVTNTNTISGVMSRTDLKSMDNTGTVTKENIVKVVSQSNQIAKGSEPSSVDGSNIKTVSQTKQIAKISKSFTDDRNNVIAPTTTTEATVTDPQEPMAKGDDLKCNARYYRPHPSDKSKYEIAFEEDVFEQIYLSCPTTLVWRQEHCRCDWADPDPVVVDTETCKCCSQGLKYSSDPKMFQRLINGEWIAESCSLYNDNQVWNNDTCTCMWDPNKSRSHRGLVSKANRATTLCMSLVNLTLDEGLKDANGQDLPTVGSGRKRIRVVDETGNIGKSIKIRRTPFTLRIFNGNDLQSHVYFKFNFKVDANRVRQRKKMVILTNGCIGWQGKAIEPSLEVSFFPINETFIIQFSTKGKFKKGKTVTEYVKGSKNDNGWYKCVLYLQDEILSFKVNGKKVFSTNGMSGGVKSTACNLTVGGSISDWRNHFDGYLDELQVVKNCKYDKETA